MIWKDQICDGKQDCLNNEDEENCRKEYCRYNVDRNHLLWRSVGRGKTSVIQCNQVPVLVKNFTEYGLKGTISRTCDDTSQPRWIKTDCQCVIDGFPKFQTNLSIHNVTYKSINNDIVRLYRHFNISPSSIPHVLSSLTSFSKNSNLATALKEASFTKLLNGTRRIIIY
ncbi:uncharacterized protein [Clytia hemisphaerica]|eukprot:TCONS_00055796-protein